MIEPCQPWATKQDLPDHCSQLEDITPATWTEALSYASTILFNLTKRRYPGVCSLTWYPMLAGCVPSTCCRSSLHLPVARPRSITSVIIDGVTLDPSKYQLLDGNLERLDGMSWPCSCSCTFLASRFAIVLAWGQDIPPSMRRAATALAEQFAIVWTPGHDAECRLSPRITSVARSGVTYTKRVDMLEIFRKGNTGLDEVDLLIEATNRGDSMAVQVIIPDRDGGKFLI